MRPGFPLLGLLALAVFGLLGWLWTGHAEGRAAEALEAEAASLDTPVAPRPPASLGAEVGPPDVGSTSREVLATEPVGVSTSNAAPTGLEIVAVVGAERKRLENVELWWLEGSERRDAWGDPTFREWLEAGQLEERMPERAVRVERDGEGRWRLPRPALEGAVVASTEGLWALESVYRNARSPLYVTLEPDLALTARVVDLSGTPVAGVHVALRQDCGDDCTIDHAVVTTDADGYARFRHYRALIDGDWDFDARYGFSIAEPLAAPVRSEFELTRPPSEVVTLVLPPTGSVVLALQAPTHVKRASLELRPAGEMVEPDEYEFRTFDGTREVAGTEVRFPFVGLGREMIARIESGEQRLALDERRAPGPTRAGQEVRLALGPLRGGAKLTGRALDESGAPLRSIRCFANFVTADRYGDGRWSRTDSEGRFEFQYDVQASGASRFELSSALESLARTGETTLSFEWPAGAAEHDVGDVRIALWPVVVEGDVVDSAGRGVEEVEITTWSFDTSSDRNPRRSPWQRDGNFRARSDSTGHFVLRSAEKASQLMLVARADGQLSKPTPVRPVDRGVKLVLETEGVLRGRLLIGENLSSDHLLVIARPEAPPDLTLPPESHPMCSPDVEGHFRYRGIRAGTYTVEVHLDGLGKPIASIPGVRIEPGSERGDPRLDPLDLRALGQWHLVRVLDPDGTPSREWAVMRPNPQDPAEFDFDWGGGPQLRVERSEAPLWICSPSSLAERLDPASVGDVVRLAPAPQVRLLVHPDSPWPAEGSLYVRVKASGEAPRFEVFMDNDLELERGVPLEFPARQLGALHVQLALELDNWVEFPSEIVRGGTIPSGSSTHIVELRWTREELDRALTEARK